jgi:hypothetical protein
MQGKWSDHLFIAIGSWWIASKLKKKAYKQLGEYNMVPLDSERI